MNAKRLHIGLAILIFAVIPLGFAESYSNRPTAAELQGLVVSGTQCARGVNERCYATQYSTNPVQYQVAPFTNTAGFYLDQSLMGTMATKIKSSLVPSYVNPDTVYDGTTNITMLTVPGVWDDLEIGDWTNKFTQTFASGTNAAIYGDSPWRIYEENLEERDKVLNALSCTFPAGGWWVPTNMMNAYSPAGSYGATWEEAKATNDALPWNPSRVLPPPHCYSGGQGGWIADKHFYTAYGRITGLNTDIVHSAIFYFKAGMTLSGSYNPEFDAFGLGFIEDAYVSIEEWGPGTDSEIITTELVGLEPSQASWIAMPWCSPPTTKGGARGFSYDGQGWLLQWDFQYCQ